MEHAARLAALVAAHEPRDRREAWSRRRMLALLAWLPAPLDEHADPTHVTGSGIVLDADDRVLLHRHKRLGTWLQPGGHLDRGESSEQAARRETAEETGIDAAVAHPSPVHLDVHQGPRGHVHLDVRWLLRVAGSPTPSPAPGESPHVAWLDLDRARRVADASTVSAVEAVLALTET